MVQKYGYIGNNQVLTCIAYQVLGIKDKIKEVEADGVALAQVSRRMTMQGGSSRIDTIEEEEEEAEEQSLKRKKSAMFEEMLQEQTSTQEDSGVTRICTKRASTEVEQIRILEEIQRGEALRKRSIVHTARWEAHHEQLECLDAEDYLQKGCRKRRRKNNNLPLALPHKKKSKPTWKKICANCLKKKRTHGRLG